MAGDNFSNIYLYGNVFGTRQAANRHLPFPWTTVNPLQVLLRYYVHFIIDIRVPPNASLKGTPDSFTYQLNAEPVRTRLFILNRRGCCANICDYPK